MRFDVANEKQTHVLAGAGEGLVYCLALRARGGMGMKKTLFAVGMALASCAAIAATEVVDGIEWTYEVIDGEASVIGDCESAEAAIPTSTSGSITIPSTLGKCPVTSIGFDALCGCSGLTSVTIPDSVTSIGVCAFDGCSGLMSVTIPNSVTNIDYGAFCGCSGLTSVTIPDSVTSIGEYAFSSCSGLTSITIPESVTSIGNYAVSSCGGLTSVTILSNFAGGWGLYVFLGCSSLTSVTIPSSVTNFNSLCSLFVLDVRGIRSATVPGWKCYIDFSSVTNLVISEGATSISDYAFSGCSSLTSVTIPSSVTSIGPGAFSGCSGLMTFDVDKDNPNFKLENNLLLTKDGMTLVAGINVKGDVIIPSSVVGIAASAFYDCSELRSVTIPSSVTSIGESAFYGCDGLTSITIPDSVTSIGESAFYGCSGLMSVAIPSSVTSVGSGAFSGCSGLTSVTFEGDAPMSGDGIFEGTPSDMVVHVKGSSSGWTQWNGRVIRFDADSGSGTSATSVNVNMTITNVIVHYIQTSEMSPMAAPITKDVGIVNVMTEVKGGNVSIPESWATNWPSFKATFGSDFSDALIAETGKVDAGGKPMMVWQDYVAGTDPTDKDDVFKASITTDTDGNLIISYTPKLSEAEKAKRKYTTWGKVKLYDEKWVEISAGYEDDYNFFKVTVEMK